MPRRNRHLDPKAHNRTKGLRPRRTGLGKTPAPGRNLADVLDLHPTHATTNDNDHDDDHGNGEGEAPRPPARGPKGAASATQRGSRIATSSACQRPDVADLAAVEDVAALRGLGIDLDAEQRRRQPDDGGA